MKLFPTNVKISDEYWNTISKYNSWFIKLRYWAVVSLVFFFIILEYIVRVELSQVQITVFSGMSTLILIYNIVFDKTQKNILKEIKNEKHLHLELYQTLFDIISLSILTYFLGGIEAPIFLFLIFHMIIGSLILSTAVMYVIAGGMIFLFSSFSILEYLSIINHQQIVGLYKNSFYNDLHFVIGFLAIFSFVMIFCIYLTSKIVYELYSRENHLKNALDQLNSAEKSKQKFIMATVHELKSPIAAASSQLDLILGGFLGDISDPVYDKIKKAKIRTEESISTINNILRVSKFKLLNKIEYTEIDLVKVISDIIEQTLPVAERKNITIHFKKDNKEIILNGDEVLLKLAFSNLISNAVKYTEKDGKVEVSLYKDGKNIAVSISDDGIGIPAKDHDKIFKEFYRASNTKEKNIEGTGTGLSIVKQILESHSGTIKFKSPSKVGSKEKPGTEFIINL